MQKLLQKSMKIAAKSARRARGKTFNNNQRLGWLMAEKAFKQISLHSVDGALSVEREKSFSFVLM
jgi:hypothetical protein